MMSEDKKYVEKGFWVHQYEDEEKFLGNMRAQGWKFVKLYKGIPTKYEFERCEPEEYIYQLDFVKTEEDTEAYHQLFKDAGWEEFMEWPGFFGKWYYFCKRKEEGQEERIYTDQESRLDLINKLILCYGSIILLLIMIELNGVRTTIYWVTEGSHFMYIDVFFSLLMLGAVVFLGYMEAGMFIARNKIKKQIEDNI